MDCYLSKVFNIDIIHKNRATYDLVITPSALFMIFHHQPNY